MTLYQDPFLGTISVYLPIARATCPVKEISKNQLQDCTGKKQ